MSMLDAIQTAGLQEEAFITNTARNSIARTLRHYNCGTPVLSGEAAVSKIQSKHQIPLEVKTAKFKFRPEDKKEVEVEYYSKCPFAAMIATLRKVRDLHVASDEERAKEVGGNMGSLGLSVVASCGADHGDIEMKGNAVIGVQEGDGQKWRYILAEYKGKESHKTLSETFFKEGGAHREGIKKIQNSLLLVVQFNGYFDFVFIPLSVIGDAYPENRLELPAGVNIVYGGDGDDTFIRGVEAQKRVFYLDDQGNTKIPSRGSTWRTLPAYVTITGDLAYLFMLQGRMNHA